MNYFFTFSFLLLAQGCQAAADAQGALISMSPDQPAFIGLASDRKGTCVLHFVKSTESADSSITVAYSAMPKLKEPETMSAIAADFATASPASSKDRFNEALLRMIKKYTIEHKTGDLSHELALDLHLLFVTLTESHVQFTSVSPAYMHIEDEEYIDYSFVNTSAPLHRSDKDLHFMSINSNGMFSTKYNKDLTCDPQTYAEQELNKQNLGKHEAVHALYNLVIDIKQWRTLCPQTHATPKATKYIQQ